MRTGLPVLVELIDLVNCYKNHVISNHRTQMANFSTRIPDCGSHSPALLDLFLSTDTSICFTMTFFWLENSDHIVVLVSIDFSSYLPQDALFHHIAYDYSCADWYDLCDNLRDNHGKIFLNSVLLLVLVNFVSGYRLELMCISLIESVRSNLTHLHGFQLLVLLS